MPNETELKLRIDPRDIPHLWRHPLLAAHTRRKWPTQKLLSIYYDTPELTLHENKIAVRLRRVGKRWIQTVKTEGQVSAGLHERPEWEYETAENTLNFQPLPDPELQDFFSADSLRQTLRPVFTTEFSRARRLLEWPSGETVEFALDRGEIRAGEQSQPLCEIELELKSGAPERLFEFALGLQADLPLQLENVSKAERGYQLATRAALTPEKADAPTLTPDLSASDAFVRIVRSGITHMQANEKGVLHGEDSEFVHQMRVAARRLRSVLTVFSEFISRERAEPIREELRWLAGELDGARNWDVFTEQTLPPILSALSEQTDLGWIVQRSAELRQQANARARTAVASPRYQRFLLTFGAWLATGAWRETTAPLVIGAPELPVLELASRILEKRHKKLKKRGKNLLRLSPEERHAVRIAAKKLRYAAEFFSSLYPRKRTRRYIQALAHLQDILGVMNDAATTRRLLQDLEADAQDATRQQAKGLVLGWVLGGSYTRLSALEQAWNEFADQQEFWSTNDHRRGAYPTFMP